MPSQPPEKKKPDSVRETRLEPAGEFIVEHRDTPPKGPADKAIHPRRPLPPVPEKKSTPDEDEAPEK